VHSETILLDLVTTENTEQIIILQELFDGLTTEHVTTLSRFIELPSAMAGVVIIHRVRPHKITHHAINWNFFESVDSI
jgi:hypothetical protein